MYFKLIGFFVCLVVHTTLHAQSAREIAFIQKADGVYAEFTLLQGERAIIRFTDRNNRVLNGKSIYVVESSNWYVGSRVDNQAADIHVTLLEKKNPVSIPLSGGYLGIRDLTAKLYIKEDWEGASVAESSEITIGENIVQLSPFDIFMRQHSVAIREVLNEEVAPTAVACSKEYADRFTRPYECMRSLIPGVQQLHEVLAYLREHDASWVLPINTTSPYVRIIDDFSEGQTHGEYVSSAFETISANKRNTCNRDNSLANVAPCYYSAPENGQVNMSFNEVDFAQRESVPPTISREDLLTHQIRIGIGTGNTLFSIDPEASISTPTLGPDQNSLEAVMDTGYITLVGGWNNSVYIAILLDPEYAPRFRLEGITERQAFSFTNRLDVGSRSCEKEGEDPATAEWCVLFPHHFVFFDEDGNLEFPGGTNEAVALYSGAVDLLRTIYPHLSSGEADAVIRSCAVDSTHAGIEVLDSFPSHVRLLQSVGSYELRKTFFGTEGIDSVTGVGRGDLSCLIKDDGSLVLDPRVLIDTSLL